jgi:hypothetical protein
MSPASTVSPATLLMLPRLQLSLAAFVLGPPIVSTIRLTIFAAQSSIPGPRMAGGTCKSRLNKCSRRSKERALGSLAPDIESLEGRVASLEEDRNRRDELDAAAIVALQRMRG